MKRNCFLFRDEHILEKAMFPAIDAHNHLWGNFNTEQIAKVMDTVGVACFCNVTANVKIAFAGGGCVVGPGDIKEFFETSALRYPG